MADISATTNLELARARWRDIVGAEKVITDPPALRSASTTTFATSQTIPTSR